MPDSSFRMIYNTSRSLEKFRIQLSNRLSAIDRTVDDMDDEVLALYERLDRLIRTEETAVDKMLTQRLSSFPVYDYWLKHVRGIGPSLSAHMLGMLITPRSDLGPSIWYSAAGLVPVFHEDTQEWHLPRPTKGEGKITYYPWLRRCLWLVGEQEVKQGRYYRAQYDREKTRLESLHAPTITPNPPNPQEWPKHRIHNVAKWAMVKFFMSHLWEMWLRSEGSPSRQPYVIEVLGHPTYYPPPIYDGTNAI